MGCHREKPSSEIGSSQKCRPRERKRQGTGHTSVFKFTWEINQVALVARPPDSKEAPFPWTKDGFF